MSAPWISPSTKTGLVRQLQHWRRECNYLINNGGQMHQMWALFTKISTCYHWVYNSVSNHNPGIPFPSGYDYMDTTTQYWFLDRLCQMILVILDMVDLDMDLYNSLRLLKARVNTTLEQLTTYPDVNTTSP